MKTVEGKYTSAKVFSNTAEDYALAQIKMLCDNEVFKDCKIRVMPDVHPGVVGPIGFTSTVGDKIMPMVVGNDIGCGITIDKIESKKKIEFQKLDKVIRENIPSGDKKRDKTDYRFPPIKDFYCKSAIDSIKVDRSIGTLGGGNHFIEMDVDDEGNYYLAVHSGSRYLGQAVTDYYLREGQKYLKAKGIEVPYELTWLEGELMEQYLHDVKQTIMFAHLNRCIILDIIEREMKLKGITSFDSNHNYIGKSVEGLTIRKGAIGSYTDLDVIIPINMKDGIILGVGKGNPDWNYSAPHGAGRIMSRQDVKSNFTINQFKSEMRGIYCSCIGRDTLDEAPFAYRGIEEIKEAISDTVEIKKILKPVYNFKAGSKEK